MKESPTFHIVHAGMQKTASKTLTASLGKKQLNYENNIFALEILGFNVSDVPELLENNINVWYDHLVKNEKSIQDVIKSYNQDNFHACVDLPGLLIQTFLYFILQTRKFVFIKLLKPFSGNAHWRELYKIWIIAK